MIPTIACVGGLTLDWIERAGKREGPYAGGNALYAAVGAWLAGAVPVIVARVGSDYPPELLADIAAHHFSTRFVRATPGHCYRVLLRDEAAAREVRYLEGSGTNLSLDSDPAELPFDGIHGAHVCAARTSTQRGILLECRARRLQTSLDLLFITEAVEPTRQEILQLIECTDVFLPSWTEVQHAWPGADALSAVRRFHFAGCPTVVIKMGAAGCVGGDGGDGGLFFAMPSVATRVVDTTGAGDAFCGAFHAKWVETHDLPVAMAWGAAAASLVIEGYGALHAIRADATVEMRDRAESALERVHVTSRDTISLRHRNSGRGEWLAR
jgi:ribokinase